VDVPGSSIDHPRVFTVHFKLSLIIAIGFILRLACGLALPVSADWLARLPDQTEYLQLGESLRQHRTLELFDQRFDDMVRAYRTPGYPAVVALCGGSVRAIRIVQALLDAWMILGIYLLGSRFISTGGGLIAAGIVAINPFSIYFSALMLSEGIYTAMVVWGMVALAGGKQFTRGRFLLGGLILALAILLRPSGLMLPVLLAVGAAWLGRGARARPWRLPIVATTLILIGLVLCPWAYRNYRILGAWVWMTSNGGITLYDGFNPDADGSSNQRFVGEMPFLRRGGSPQMDEVQRSEYLGARAAEWMRQHPAESCKLAIIKIARTWSPIPLSAEYGSQAKYVLVGLLYTLPFDVLIVLGLFSDRLTRPAKVFLLLPALYFTGVHALSVGSLRYRLPAEPPMAIVAAAGISSLAADRKWRRALVMASDDAHQPS
jgi:4-amino-4-deoxy-L-arabinose transferase-like glycosyltransferase